MEETDEKKKGEEVLKKSPNRIYSLGGIPKEPEERFSSFWGDLSSDRFGSRPRKRSDNRAFREPSKSC